MKSHQQRNQSASAPANAGFNMNAFNAFIPSQPLPSNVNSASSSFVQGTSNPFMTQQNA
jgi:hypothetical protein